MPVVPFILVKLAFLMELKESKKFAPASLGK